MRSGSRLLLVVIALLLLGLVAPALIPRERSIVLATTTSTEDSGLLDYLLPSFTAATAIQVRVIAVGTGQALELGRRGDADVVLTHAPGKEREFLTQGHAAYREPVMHNFFILVGPATDPARARGDDIALGMERIATGQWPFISRGDGSGTHTKELELWSLAKIRPEPGGWYKEAGEGMGATLRIADQLLAYTLTDDGTFATMAGRLDLVPIVENIPPLQNNYSVMPVNPEKHPTVRYADAHAFAQWLIGPGAQALIAEYRIGGRSIFTPDASP